jgi:hypothetical protein
MGFFSKLLGSKNEAPQKAEKPMYAQSAPTEVIRAGGELPQTAFTPEANETPRTIQCLQYKYGKILQTPEGPIFPGCEHGGTGKSKDFPRGIPVHPNKFFKSLSISGIPENYPWNEGGPIVKKIFEVDGKQYVVCAREMWRSENGEGVQGRMYTEMHEIAIPAEEWSVAVIPQLSKNLEAKGVTEQNGAMPSVELKTDILDQPLSKNWLDDYTKDMIANIVSGKPITLQDWGVSQGDFLRKLFYASICLPENLARQMSFGAGLNDMDEGQVRVAHTMKAKGLRKIGGRWKGNNEVDVTFGQRYLTALISVLGNCQTPREVMAAVQNIPQDISCEVEKRFNAA